MSASEKDDGLWNEALAEWGDGPRTMKATADWANRWVHRLRTEDERKCIALQSARAEGHRAGMLMAAEIAEKGASGGTYLAEQSYDQGCLEVAAAIRAAAGEGDPK